MRRRSLEAFEDGGRQDVACGNREAARSLVARRLLDERVDLDDAVAEQGPADDAVALDFLERHFL